ncbi:[protein-PII] uridylyltransferase [Roseimaritima ulvae]|uniref:Bifunctional uridylyltransferase/uridylyl-removing enzyme n=1 Tax=Roseimaritima ulvae TaxID=980254 RepID=A0A5B9QYK1_9BACT|nr:[protein-PII] uridylyltransferase [Roseimaritima ulvae]QEG42930.1 Bifunctional uridylyltransferase/uridylyl-removing enzyme [Roseimaritima ulvae]
MASFSGPSLRPAVIQARERLKAGRERIRQHHQSGVAGVQVCTALTDLVDSVILSLWQATVESYADDEALSQAVLVAHGGFGRRDLAPYSDVDLMVVPKTGDSEALQPVASQFTRDIVDAGLQLGFTIRTQTEACRWAWKDATVFSSLAESRLLAGSLQTFQRYFHSLRKGSQRRQQRLIQSVDAARRDERQKWGETNYLLRPNVKRSRGALRDIQLIRWIGFASYGETDLARLVRLGDFPEDDFNRVRAAYSFMLQLRNELHFASGKNQDVLDRASQLDIARRWGYVDHDNHLPVEWFMKDYFEHSRNVRYAVSHFLATTRRNPLLTRSADRMFSKAVDKDIRLGPYHIWVKDRHLQAFARDLPSVLRLMDYANRYQRRIAHRTWEEIRNAMMEQPIGPLDVETGRQFISLLSRPGRLPSLLRRLHELRILEKLIPAMHRARGMLEFNQYHKYTVDAHSIRAVEAATRFDQDESLAGEVYRGLKDKRLLHLALLMHDLGKGYEEEHSQVGYRIALETCPRLGLDQDATETVAKLILLHLTMNNTSSQHDLSDPEIVSRFAATVGSMRMLDLLLIHSMADMKAVGPGVLTDWKRRLLEELYVRTRQYFDSGHLPGEMDEATQTKREEIRHRLRATAGSEAVLQRSETLLASLSALMLQRRDADTLAQQVSAVAQLDEHSSLCWCRSLDEQEATEYTLVRAEQSAIRGLFARAAGTFTAQGLGILRAEVATLQPDIAWDTFVIKNPTTVEGQAQQPQVICNTLCQAIDSEHTPKLNFPRVWKSTAAGQEAVMLLPTRVTFDNETFDKYTVLSLFAYDRPGLLYSIAQTLSDESLLVHFAKISTHLDQVMDIFYVTDREGQQVTSQARQDAVRAALIEAAA